MRNNDLELVVQKARHGCRDSMNMLAERTQDGLYSYLYRLTLDENLSREIRQETLLEMCRSLKNLREDGAFKSWLYKTAWGKLHDHYRKNKNKVMSLDNNNLTDKNLYSNLTGGLEKLVSKEIAESLVNAISQLNILQKNVFMLRCYENLSYSEIASITDSSELAVRIAFHRARHKLQKTLMKKGITISMFLSLLGIFGQATSPSNAAVIISASTLKVGMLASSIAMIMSKFIAYIISTIVGIALVLAGVAMISKINDPATAVSAADSIKSFHYIKQAWENSYIPNANLIMGKSLSRGAYEQWFFFPDGVKGPLFKITQRWDPQVQSKLCSWLINGNGYHYYHSGEKKIYLFNNMNAYLTTPRFPFDSQELIDFLDKMDGKEEGVQYTRDAKSGLLVELYDNRFANSQNFKSSISYNNLDEKTFGDFRYKWPQDAPVLDYRDEIHKQGWTAFEINGEINGIAVHGNCRIPFIYNKLNEYPPLLKLQIGNNLILADSSQGAVVSDSKGNVLAAYPAGTFLKGLMRPWFGMHTMDIVRRDSAESWIPFKVENFNFQPNNYDYQKRTVTMYDAPGYKNTQISIYVDIDNNQIEKIEFKGANGGDFGKLEFTYPAEPSMIGEIPAIPQAAIGKSVKKKPMGIFWLFKLAEGELGE